MNAPIMNKPVPEGRYATLPNGYRIHYLDEGQGPVVVFLHGSGSGACGYSNFKGNYPALVKAGYRVILPDLRSEEHTSELQSLMRISYAVFCLKYKNKSHSHLSQ